MQRDHSVEPQLSRFEDDFTTPVLRPDLWVPAYLPQWTTPDRAAARWRQVPSGLELRIEEDQLDWRPEDAPLRVSNLQTGVHSGAVGSTAGTHRHRQDGLVVRTDVGTTLLWAPTSGHLEITVSASTDPGCMLAAWLIGTEHLDSAQSGEICLFEIDADAITAHGTTARSGIKAHHDPSLRDDMTDVQLPLDASTPHTWTLDWGQSRTTIRCEGVLVRSIEQAPDYPMFLMLDLFEIGPRSGTYPKAAILHRAAGHSY